MEGWVKLYRQTLENPIVCKDAEYFSVWCYLILNATHKSYKVEFKGEVVTLNPGQLITGRKKIAQQFNISESKVQRILKKLEIEQQIEQQTSTKKRLISVLNWDKYQSSEQQDEQQVNNKRTTSEQRVNTNKNVRTEECKECKKKPSKPQKKNFADYVKMTEEQYEKLVADYGKQRADDMIERLNEYKGSKGKRYKDDYLTCKSWFRKDGVKPKEKEKERDYKIFGDDPADLEGIDDENIDF